MRHRKTAYIYIGITLILVLVMGIAFSALSKTLTIKSGKITQNVEAWNVAFSTIGNINPVAVRGESNVGRKCGTAVATATSISINDTKVGKPGDECVWKFTVKNSGTISAKLSKINFTQPGQQTCEMRAGYDNAVAVCGNVTYKLTTDQAGSLSNTIKLNSTIAPSGGTYDFYLTARYNKNVLTETEQVQTGINIGFVYVQN